MFTFGLYVTIINFKELDLMCDILTMTRSYKIVCVSLVINVNLFPCEMLLQCVCLTIFVLVTFLDQLLYSERWSKHKRVVAVSCLLYIIMKIFGKYTSIYCWYKPDNMLLTWSSLGYTYTCIWTSRVRQPWNKVIQMV